MSSRLKMAAKALFSPESLLSNQSRSLDQQLEAAGVHSIKQLDHYIRFYEMRKMNALIDNPMIGIDDKIRKAVSMFYEVGTMWSAPGGNPAQAQLVNCVRVLNSMWRRVYSSVKSDFTYYTYVIQMDDDDLMPTLSDGGSLNVSDAPIPTTHEYDEKTYGYLQTIKKDFILIAAREHIGRFESRGELRTNWTKEQMNRLLDRFGYTEVLEFVRQALALQILPEHVNPRTNIIIQGMNQQANQAKTIVPTSNLRRPEQQSAASMQ